MTISKNVSIKHQDTVVHGKEYPTKNAVSVNKENSVVSATPMPV